MSRVAGASADTRVLLLVTGAALPGALDWGAAGVGAWGVGTAGGEISGSESVSMLSHFE